MRRIRINVPVPHHLVEAVLLVSGGDEFRPDLQPFAGVAIDFLFADFDADIVDQRMPDVVCPVDGNRVLWIRGIGWNGGEIDFQEEGAQEICAAGQNRADATAKIKCAVDFDRDAFDGERGIAAIHMFEECELWIRREIEILATLGDQL